MLNLVLPWYARWITLAVAMFAAFAYGAAKVYRIEEAKRTKEIAAIKLEGERQNAKTAETVAKQKQVTLDIVEAYNASINRINDYYGERLRIAGSNRGKVPAVPATVTPACQRSADDVSIKRSEIEFRRQCTITTQMFVSLRDWILKQEKENDDNAKR